jgi:hypothetical protein
MIYSLMRVEEMLRQSHIEIDIETIHLNSFMESQPMEKPQTVTTITGKLIVNKKACISKREVMLSFPCLRLSFARWSVFDTSFHSPMH